MKDTIIIAFAVSGMVITFASLILVMLGEADTGSYGALFVTAASFIGSAIGRGLGVILDSARNRNIKR